MATQQRTQELLQELHEAVYGFEEEQTVALVQAALAEG
jgi:methanogenic corrinoid protein MtbC1